jgi:hypothetical protein
MTNMPAGGFRSRRRSATQCKSEHSRFRRVGTDSANGLFQPGNAGHVAAV